MRQLAQGMARGNRQAAYPLPPTWYTSRTAPPSSCSTLFKRNSTGVLSCQKRGLLKHGDRVRASVRRRGQQKAQLVRHALLHKGPVDGAAAADQQGADAEQPVQLFTGRAAVQGILPGQNVGDAPPLQVSPVGGRGFFREHFNDMGVRRPAFRKVPDPSPPPPAGLWRHSREGRWPPPQNLLPKPGRALPQLRLRPIGKFPGGYGPIQPGVRLISPADPPILFAGRPGGGQPHKRPDDLAVQAAENVNDDLRPFICLILLTGFPCSVRLRQ